MMRALSLVAVLGMLLGSMIVPARAQSTSAIVVSSCGTPPVTYVAGFNRQLTQDTTGKLCDSGGGGGGSTTVAPTGAASTDISGTVTTGGSYQTVAASSATRKNCTIENPTTATEPLLVKFGTMAQPYSLAPGQPISALNGVVVATDAITLTAATTAHAYAGTCQ